MGSPRSCDDGVRGDKPRLKKAGELAQLGERLVCIQEVTGSSPVFSTKFGRGEAPRPKKFDEGRYSPRLIFDN